MTKQQTLLGAHMSIAGGIPNAIPRGEELDCTAIQIFTKNASRWQAKPITDEEATAFRDAFAKSSIESVIAHDSYLINLASADAAQWQKSLDAFVDEMHRCQQLGVPALVMHPGSPKDAGVDTGIDNLVRGIKAALADTEDVRILVENIAGQGTGIGRTLEEIARIVDGVDSDRVGICIDTCHAFAAGFDLSTPEGYDQFFADLDRLIGIDKIGAFHLNDSKKGLGSRVDRHDHIGLGEIGPSCFEMLMTDSRFIEIPKVIETPAGDSEEGVPMNRINLGLLRSYAEGKS